MSKMGFPLCVLLSFLSVSSVYASTVISTSVSCTANISGMSTTQANASGCQLNGNSADFTKTYLVSATATATASGGSTGYISARVTATENYAYYETNPPYTYEQFAVFASAEVVATYTTSGPERAGHMIFTPSSFPTSDPFQPYPLQYAADIIITQGKNVTDLGAVNCDIHENPVCPSYSIPIELGTPFTLEAYTLAGENASVNGSDFRQFVWDASASGYIALSDLNGNAVDVSLTDAPEPGTCGAVSLSFVFLGAAIRKKKWAGRDCPPLTHLQA